MLPEPPQSKPGVSGSYPRIVSRLVSERRFGLVHARRSTRLRREHHLDHAVVLRDSGLYGRAHPRDRQTWRQDGGMAERGTVVELRVHGVSGSPPEALLGGPAEFIVRKAGDKDAGFYRRQPWIDEVADPTLPANQWRRLMEAYSWGALTSG